MPRGSVRIRATVWRSRKPCGSTGSATPRPWSFLLRRCIAPRHPLVVGLCSYRLGSAWESRRCYLQSKLGISRWFLFGHRVIDGLRRVHLEHGRRKTLLETPADALVAPRGAPDASDANAGAGRHAQGEVPELVPWALPRAQRCPLRTCPRRLTPGILVLPIRWEQSPPHSPRPRRPTCSPTGSGREFA